MLPTLQFYIRNQYYTLYVCNTGKKKSITKKLIINIHDACSSHIIMSSTVLIHVYIQFISFLQMFFLQLYGNRQPPSLSYNFLKLFILIRFKVLFYLCLVSISVLARSKPFLQLSQTNMKYWTEVPSRPQDLPSSNSTGEKNKNKNKTKQNKRNPQQRNHLNQT